MKIILDPKTMSDLLHYLAAKPYAEVSHLLAIGEQDGKRFVHLVGASEEKEEAKDGDKEE